MDVNTKITLGDAYRAMFEFIDAYWRRGNRSEEDDPIASLLGDIQFGVEQGPTATADPAQWFDWLDAVRKVTK